MVFWLEFLLKHEEGEVSTFCLEGKQKLAGCLVVDGNWYLVWIQGWWLKSKCITNEGKKIQMVGN